MLPHALLTLALSLTAVSAIPAAPSPLVAKPANDVFPIVRTLGSVDPTTGAATTSVEGVSTDKSGSFYCVTSTSFVSLNGAGETLYAGSGAKKQLLAASRWTPSGSYYLGDAGQHQVLKSYPSGAAPKVEYASTSWLQPNDITASNCFGNWYFSGMNYAAGTGDLHYAIGADKTPRKVEKLDIGRTNGIEVSADGKWVLITGAKFGPEGSKGKIEAAGIYAYPLVKGVPQVKGGEKPLFDIYTAIPEAKVSQADPDGMRSDVKGNVYSTLNAWGRILTFNIKTPSKFQVVELPSVAFPTNLEMGGADGKTLVVVGKCKEGPKYKGYLACVDKMQVPYPGRQWSALNNKL